MTSNVEGPVDDLVAKAGTKATPAELCVERQSGDEAIGRGRFGAKQHRDALVARGADDPHGTAHADWPCAGSRARPSEE
ncbi:MAG: hypothetical protein AAGD10_15520 [Myxococcota bacterium]